MRVKILTEKATGAKTISLEMSPMDTLGLARILDLHGDVARDVAQAGEMSETELAGVETIRSTVKTLRKAVYQCSN